MMPLWRWPTSTENRKSHSGDKTILRPSYLHNKFPLLVRWHLYIEWGPQRILISLQTLFDNNKEDKQESGKFGIEIPDIPEDDAMENGGAGEGAAKGAAKGSKKSNKRLSVERIYQKKTQLEHILLRPDTYVGSIEAVEQVGV